MAPTEPDFIEGDEVLLRRCPNSRQFLSPPMDFVTSKPKLTAAGFRIVIDEDGVSVFRDALLQREGQKSSSVSNEGACYVFAFPAWAARVEGWDALYAPTDEDEIGHAHSLIAPCLGYRYSKSDKASFQLMRASVIALAEAVFIPAAA